MTSRKSARPKAAAARASAADAPQRYSLEFLESALREWQALDGSVKAVFKKQLEARLENPHFPGSELHGALSGCYKIKLRAQGYRRDKDKVYQAALRRIEALVDDLGSRPPARKAPRRGTA